MSFGDAQLRYIPVDLDPAVVEQIDLRLDVVEREHRVVIALAIESGSRAWGFPSPDSDYDCRFVYVRPLQDYLKLFLPRDVIETPMTDVLDVNGWDLAKALRLMLNGNAVIIEWLTSPLIYRGDAGFRSEFVALAREVAERDRLARHYLHLGWSIYNRHLAADGDIKLKKVFYALRPAIALRWLTRHPEARIAPMNFHELLVGCELPADLERLIGKLLAVKAVTREMGDGPLPEVLRSFIVEEFNAAEQRFTGREPIAPSSVELADAFFVRWVDRLGSLSRPARVGEAGD